MATYLPRLAQPERGKSDELPVSEVFYTIQGEGRWNGTPSVFVRLMYCNVGCSWCDTRYTWDTDQLDGAAWDSVDALADRCVSLVPTEVLARGSVHVILSGGEPLLYADRLPRLIEACRGRGFGYFEVETSATIRPDTALLDVVDWWNCSPKLANSGIPSPERIRPEAIRAFVDSGKADFLFVVRDESDVREMEATYGSLVPSDRIWLMPEGADVERQLRRSREIVEVCMRTGYRLGLRSHIFFWGSERGR